MTTENIKYLGINLKRNVQNLYFLKYTQNAQKQRKKFFILE